jgi:uncharacterized protein YdiU (UPF0061 family)
MPIKTVNELASASDYSFLKELNPNPKTKEDGYDHNPREVTSGHYVLVQPTPIENPHYVTHSKQFFKELGILDELANSQEFKQMFSADLSSLPPPLKKVGWATGYALSIYGTEYYQQCPFGTGNGYGDGRAISIFEGVLNGKRWEMQLKGAGRTPYCRGGDGRAVLRSSIREFLAQEHMSALNVPTSRSLSLFVSKTERVSRPWYKEYSYSKEPEVMVSEPVAITTRVAPSFIRVGQIELFARRARKNEHQNARQELELMVLHLIQREYSDEIESSLSLEEKVLLLAKKFRSRLSSLVSNWIRVGYCQGNFNSDNCAVGGFTLDYGPFGFCDIYNPKYQPWTGGGEHFAFLNQPHAAKKNFHMFCKSLLPLLESDKNAQIALEDIDNGFHKEMHNKMTQMWADKLGLERFDAKLFKELEILMLKTGVDYTLFFRELSSIPDTIEPLMVSFYNQTLDKKRLSEWSSWLKRWRELACSSADSLEKLSKKMKLTNPKYTLREWMLVPAYQQAYGGDYTLLKELQEIITCPYDELSYEIEQKYYKRKPDELFGMAGVSFMSCSS